MKTIPKPELFRCYTLMVRIRQVEEKLMEVFSAGEIPGFIHVCIGQEAAPAAVGAHLTSSDYLAATHRGHGHALAKGIELKRFMAELYGKRNGPCRGRSGSMHLAEPDIGLLGANGIVGGGIPVALGAAFAARFRKTDQVTVCCFGEGATDEGTFHESMNFAVIHRLPIIFLCENNGWAEFTPQDVHMAVRDVAQRGPAYGMPSECMANDFFEIHEQAEAAVARARAGEGPTLLEVRSRRWYGHFVGDAQKYRPEEDVEEARRMDCVRAFEEELLRRDVLGPEDVERIRGEIQEEIGEAVAFARESPYPEPSELMEDLYA